MTRETTKGRSQPPPASIGDGRARVLVQGVLPEIDGGRYPIKRIVGDRLVVEADLVTDGHDIVRGALLYRPPGAPAFREVAMEPLGNDRFRASFQLTSSAGGS